MAIGDLSATPSPFRSFVTTTGLPGWRTARPRVSIALRSTPTYGARSILWTANIRSQRSTPVPALSLGNGPSRLDVMTRSTNRRNRRERGRDWSPPDMSKIIHRGPNLRSSSFAIRHVEGSGPSRITPCADRLPSSTSRQPRRGRSGPRRPLFRSASSCVTRSLVPPAKSTPRANRSTRDQPLSIIAVFARSDQARMPMLAATIPSATGP